MRANFPAFLLAISASCAGLLAARQTPSGATAQPQAANLLAQSLAALNGTVAVGDVTLTGTAERVAGSDIETGTAVYSAVPSANRLDLSLSGKSYSEIHTLDANGPGGVWIGPDGATDVISSHNLLADTGLFPVFTVARLLSTPNCMLTYVGLERKNGISVIHIQSSQQAITSTAFSALTWQHLTHLDIYFDASTLLPAELDFNIHPDNNALLDIPEEIVFSDYRTVGSLTIPFHVQQSRNGSLFLDLQFQQASINSGLSSNSAIFTIQ